MNIFGVLIHWSKKTPDSKGYPHVSDVMKRDYSGSETTMRFKSDLTRFATLISKEPEYIFYSRVDSDLTLGESITLTAYTSEAAYKDIRQRHAEALSNLEVSRAAFCEEQGLVLEEKLATFSLASFNENHYAKTLEFFNSIPKERP